MDLDDFYANSYFYQMIFYGVNSVRLFAAGNCCSFLNYPIFGHCMKRNWRQTNGSPQWISPLCWIFKKSLLKVESRKMPFCCHFIYCKENETAIDKFQFTTKSIYHFFISNPIEIDFITTDLSETCGIDVGEYLCCEIDHRCVFLGF